MSLKRTCLGVYFPKLPKMFTWMPTLHPCTEGVKFDGEESASTPNLTPNETENRQRVT